MIGEQISGDGRNQRGGTGYVAADRRIAFDLKLWFDGFFRRIDDGERIDAEFAAALPHDFRKRVALGFVQIGQREL